MDGAHGGLRPDGNGWYDRVQDAMLDAGDAQRHDSDNPWPAGHYTLDVDEPMNKVGDTPRGNGADASDDEAQMDEVERAMMLELQAIGHVGYNGTTNVGQPSSPPTSNTAHPNQAQTISDELMLQGARTEVTAVTRTMETLSAVARQYPHEVPRLMQHLNQCVSKEEQQKILQSLIGDGGGTTGDGNEADDEGSDDEDEDTNIKDPRQGCRKYNLFNCYFRDFLSAKGVVPSKYKGTDLPAVTPSEADAWSKGHIPGPDAVRPRLDWGSSMSEGWNLEAIHVLCNAFLNEVSAKQHLPLSIAECPPRRQVYKNCLKKLQRIQLIYKHHKTLTPIALKNLGESKKARARRDIRRKGTYARRRRIIEQQMNTDPSLWKHVSNIVDILDMGGMSSDHTDDQTRRGAKTVTRARTLWRSAELAQLMNAIETYPGIEGTSAGNKKYERNFDLSKAATSSRIAKRKLPLNFYDPLWYASLPQSKKLHLAPKKEVKLPKLADHEL